MKILYPELVPYRTFRLKVGNIHQIYVEESGNSKGFPVIFLHGGPCSGSKPDHRRFFNPEFYRIILFDQRGCGQSIPFGELIDNNTHYLIEDLEAIRSYLDISKWLVFGGSWGAALALLYAQRYTSVVAGLILRGTFLARFKDLDWFAGNGANRIYPEGWQEVINILGIEAANDPVTCFWQAINAEDSQVRFKAAKVWQDWNAQVALGNTFERQIEQDYDQGTKDIIIQQVRMEVHYALHNYFITENQILIDCLKLQNVSTTIIHGRYDLMCPVESAWQLHQALPQANLVILPNAGHVSHHPEMVDALVMATDQFSLISSLWQKNA